MISSTSNSLNRYILNGTERCVACGLCLPWCPTYQLEHREFESPRGRLALLQALARSELRQTDSTSELLAHCLLCRSCEKHCPSSVPFGEIMDASRRQTLQTKPQTPGLSRKLAEFALRRPEWLRRLGYPASMLRMLLPGGMPIANSTIPSMRHLPSVQAHSAWRTIYPATSDKRGQVSLFLGCVARTLDARTIDDAIRLLNLQGFDVLIPSQQACCGALSLHEGRYEVALELMRTNRSAFGDEHIESVVHMSTGCGASLNEYTLHIGDDRGLSDKVSEICAFVDQQWLNRPFATATDRHIMLHCPCSLRNGSMDPEAPVRLLAHAPGIRVTQLDSGYGCCGAAGTHMLSRPETAATLRSPLIDQIMAEKPDAVATTNPGCALHLSEGLRAAGMEIPVLHPVSVLIDQLLKSEE